MAQELASYVTLDVFTAQAFSGNQLAVVKIEGDQLSKKDKQSIAREFNFSETVFLYYDDPRQPPRLEIFTPVNEMDFAGHPVIGLGHVLFRGLLNDLPVPATKEYDPRTIMTKSGPVVIQFDAPSQTVSAEIPHNVHLHSQPVPVQRLLDTQKCLSEGTARARLQAQYPVLSIVKGVSYVLADLTDTPDIFAAVTAGKSPAIDLDDGWRPSFAGTMYYRRTSPLHSDQGTMVQDLRVRMIAIDLEDPACGSGSASLSAYLALQDGRANGKYKYNIDQGSEIGRQSYITVEVFLNDRGDGISMISLAGQAALVTEGRIYLPA
ncbi:PhzF family phenazine biosynthesis protein [Aspergillus mulundensis]|uniref:Phenazine biosynthesis-like protein n=1 Tax=Aspergillus mulundensis TaxID=1810919 RepID=A0A3D8T4I6_9EURO|nr:Phenazine biosynthesis-like protein [Aspergillus mulundensis]RDW93465.1 Phenazine biosynthesis-like protein [Aspergillus mulundensis]